MVKRSSWAWRKGTGVRSLYSNSDFVSDEALQETTDQVSYYGAVGPLAGRCPGSIPLVMQNII